MFRYRWRENNWKGIVHSDGCGYYAYLPAVLIHHDLQYRFYLDLKDKYGFGDLSENFCQSYEGRLYNRYFCGTAIAELPFFLLAWLASVLTGYDADGHSFLFHASLNIAALFYVLAGMYFLSKYLRRHFNPWIVASVLGAIFLGTNLFNYTVNEPAYSHAYSFAFICFFIYRADISIRTLTKKSYVLLALNAAMIVLIRPSNAVVLLALPFIAGSFEAFMLWLKNGLKMRIAVPAIVAGILPISIQSILFYAQCRLWWVDGYANEEFHFLEPNILKVMFSYRAGIFTWSPATWLVIPGLIVIWIKNKFEAFSWTAFMFVNLWIMSSWWAWHYAGTFGMRPFVDHMSWMTIPMCYFISIFNRRFLKVAAGILIIGLTLIGHIFNYQAMRMILPHDLMTKEKFWYIFLKTDNEYSYDLDPPYKPYMPNPIDKVLVRHYAFESAQANEIPAVYSNFYAADTLQYAGTGDVDLISIPTGALKGALNYYADLKLKVFYPSLYNSGTIHICFKAGGEVVQCQSRKVIIPDYKPNEWHNFRFVIKSTVDMQEVDEVVIRMTNGQRDKILLQQLEFTLASF